MIDNKKVIYTGVFFEDSKVKELISELDIKPLDKLTPDTHVTFGFRKGLLFPEEMIGKKFEVKVIGVGSDENNQGFEVELPSEIEEFYKGATVKHLTFATSETGKPVDTAKLTFEKISEPKTITCIVGYFDGKIHKEVI